MLQAICAHGLDTEFHMGLDLAHICICPDKYNACAVLKVEIFR